LAEIGQHRPSCFAAKGVTVQGWVADDVAKKDTVASFVSVQCAACGLAHYINPKTGKRLGEDK